MTFECGNGFTYDSEVVAQMSRFLDEAIGPPLAIVPFSWDEDENERLNETQTTLTISS